MEIQKLIDLYPFVYHMTEYDNWPNIEEHGLLSTSALLDLYEITGTKRTEIEKKQRKEITTLTHENHKNAYLRDQKPLNIKNLDRLLTDMEVEDYILMLNNKSFFWLSKEKLQSLQKAKHYRGKSHIVITIDTKVLIEKYQDSVRLSRINSGATMFGNGKRGSETFKKIEDYPFEENKNKNKNNPIVELAVDTGITEIKVVAVKVQEWKDGVSLQDVWIAAGGN